MELHPLYHPRDVLDFCAENNIHVTAYSSLGTTVAKGKTNELLTSEEVKKAADECGVSPAKGLLRWALDKGYSVVPKSTDPGHIAENAQVMDFEFGDKARKILDGMADEKAVKFAWNPNVVV